MSCCRCCCCGCPREKSREVLLVGGTADGRRISFTGKYLDIPIPTTAPHFRTERYVRVSLYGQAIAVPRSALEIHNFEEWLISRLASYYPEPTK